MRAFVVAGAQPQTILVATAGRAEPATTKSVALTRLDALEAAKKKNGIKG